MEGSYDVVPGSEEDEVMIMLKFTTNMRTSPCYGLDDDPSFVLHKEGHKIVGFHEEVITTTSLLLPTYPIIQGYLYLISDVLLLNTIVVRPGQCLRIPHISGR